jgi:hypothetical protein
MPVRRFRTRVVRATQRSEREDARDVNASRPARTQVGQERPRLRMGLAGATFLLGCASRGAVSPATTSVSGTPPLNYERPQMWLCRPDLSSDACRGELDATELRPDGSRVVIPFVPAPQPRVDCFYVYPTVDMAIVPGNHTDFADTARMRESVRAQAARFGAVCRVFAPVYRQMTIGTYFAPSEDHARRFAIAFSDVEAAFRWYLAHAAPDRRFVLLGHSQGAQMVERLLQTRIDNDDSLRSRLVVAMPIGGDVETAMGSSAGGTFQNIPLCTSPDELRCVIAFNTLPPEGVKHPWPGPPPPGHHTACVNPAEPPSGGATVSPPPSGGAMVSPPPSGGAMVRPRLLGAVFPTHSAFRDNMPGSQWSGTPFIVVRDFYESWCVERSDGIRYLAVRAAPKPFDKRAAPIDLDRPIWRTTLGLHLLDMQFTQEDLVRLIERKTQVRARIERRDQG